MRGRVKNYNSEKGFGFITDQNGTDRFFHISNVTSNAELQRGLNVTFTPADGKKGPVANNISIVEVPTFITLGDTRLKLSNIKQYGISTETETKEYAVEITEKKSSAQRVIDGVFGVLIGVETALLGNTGAGVVKAADMLSSEVKRKETKTEVNNYDYLYVTTYQGNNYKFYQDECDFNIHEKLKYLDELFGAT